MDTEGAYQGPLLVVLSAPSGAGKDAVRDELRNRGRNIHFVVTATTRAPRQDEQHGAHYHFLDTEAFKRLASAGGLLEWERYDRGMYGSPRSEVEDALARGQDALMRIDVRGALTIKRLAPEATLIFIRPPSLAVLRDRMTRRGSETQESLDRRIEMARGELAQESAFDYSVLNAEGELSRAVDQVEAILTAEHCRIGRRPVVIAATLPTD